VEGLVDHRGEQVVRRGDRVEVAGEMQVDPFRRLDRRRAAADGASLDAEAWPQRWLAQRQYRRLAELGQSLSKPDGGGRLALARGVGVIADTNTSRPSPGRARGRARIPGSTLAMNRP
jgi:hypothetical protein